MRILQLSKKFPYPLNDGESIAVTNLSKSLNEQGCEISLLSMNTSKDFVDVEKYISECSHYNAIETVFVDNEISLQGAFINLLKGQSYHLSRFISQEYKSKLIKMLQSNDYDVVQLETVYLAPYIDVIREFSDALVVMRAHNIEYEIWERIAQNTHSLPRKLYINYLTKKLKKEEISFLNKYDLLIAISDRDLECYKALGFSKDAYTIPIGINPVDYLPIKLQDQAQSEYLRPCFIGSLNWAPNIEGIKWFLDDIWDNIQEDYPKMKFHIAGKNAINSKDYYRNGVVYHGEVSSATYFLRKNNILVVPLLSGSGMRAKILEGMALGMTVITTKLGLEGIPAQNRKHVLIANTLKDFKDIFAMLQDDPTQIYNIGARARKFVLENYSSETIAIQLLNIYKNKLNKIDYQKSDSKVMI